MSQRRCPVLGCNSKAKDDAKHFFKFPKVDKKIGDISKVWLEFTRRKNYKSTSERICEDHFAADCFKIGPKGRPRLKKGTVPTIYFHNGKKVVVPYDSHYQKYYGDEAQRMFAETDAATHDHEKDLTDLRYKKICELKNLCRFCFINSSDSKCIAMSQLENYAINPRDMLRIIGSNMEHSETFSEIICEPCFLKAIEIENFRRKCSNAQKDLLDELEELDKKIQKVQKVKKKNDMRPWFHTEVKEQPKAFESPATTSNIHFYHVDIKNEEIIESDDDLIEHDEIEHDDGEVAYGSESDFDETKAIEQVVEDVNGGDEVMEAIYDDGSEIEQCEKQLKKVSTTINYKERTYECFFCREKFLGKKIFKKHPCPVKTRECIVPGCGKSFANQGAYANHVTKTHGMPKTSCQYCPACKTYYQMTIIEYKEHSKKCTKENMFEEQPIKCEICRKVCCDLDSYTAHKLFHGTQNIVPQVDENGEPIDPKRRKFKRMMCDLCGKTLSDYKNLRKHKVNVHLVDFKGDMFICDLCPVQKPTRRMIYTHMKSVHIIDWQSCDVCGKEFKSKRLVMRHKLYMHERNRLAIRCQLCPHKPGFNATVYLEQHMRKHHGDNSAKNLNRFRCDFGFCDASYSNQKNLNHHKINMHGYNCQ